MDRELNGYLRKVEKRICAPAPLRRAFLQDAREKAECFLSENPTASFQDVQAFLGDPEKLAAAFTDTLEPDNTARYIRRKQWVRRLALGVLVAFCLLSITYGVIAATYAIYPRVTVTETIYINP